MWIVAIVAAGPAGGGQRRMTASAARLDLSVGGLCVDTVTGAAARRSYAARKGEKLGVLAFFEERLLRRMAAAA